MKTETFWKAYMWWIVAVVGLLVVVAAVTIMASQAQDETVVAPAPLPSTITPMFSVKDYGAKGDGVTNDEAAILATVAAANGAIVYFPDGSYLVGKSFKLPDSVLAKGGVNPASYLTVVEAVGTVTWRWVRP